MIDDLNRHGDFADDASLAEAYRANDSQFMRGLRSGAYGAGSSLNTLAGAVGQSVGADQFAAGRFASARGLQQDAAEAAPRITSFRDAGGSLRDAGDYAAGILGQAVPYIAGGIGATALSGGAMLPALAANTALLAPVEIGDVLQRQQAQGQPLNLRDAALTGLGSAAVQGIVPALATGKALGKTAARGAARELVTTPIESAATEAGGEAIKQVGSGQGLDTGQLAEAAVGGAVGGAPFGGLAAAGAVRGQVADAGRSALDAVKTAAGAVREKAAGATNALPEGSEVVQGLKNRSQEAADALEALTGRVAERSTGAMDAVSQGMPPRFKELAGKTGEEFNSLLQRMDEETIPKVREWGEQMLDRAGLDEGKRQQLTQAMGDLGQEANRTAVAVMRKGLVAADSAKQQAKGFYESAKKWFDRDRPTTDAKKSEDFSGIRKVITDTVVPALRETNPAALEDAEAMQHTADGLRMFIEQVARREPGQLDSDTVAGLIDTFGEKTTDVLNKVYAATRGEDRAGAENFFGALNQIRDLQRKDAELTDVMAKNLKQDLQQEYTTADLRELARELKKWVTRTSDGSEQSRFYDQRVNDMIAQTFDKPDAVLAMLTKSTKEEQAAFAKDALETDEEGNSVNPDAVDYTDVLQESGPARSLVHKQAVPSPDAHRAEFGNEGQAERLIREAKARDGGLEARWMSAEDFHTEEGSEMPPEAKGKGYVVAERMKGSDKLTPEQAASFKFDSGKGDRRKSKSVIDAGEGVLLDAKKLGRPGPGEELAWNDADDQGSMVRLQRTVLNNVAAVQDTLGRKFKLADEVVVASRSGKDITWGEIKSLKQSTDEREGRSPEDAPEREQRLRKQLRELEFEMLDAEPAERRKLRPKWEKLKDQIEQLDSADRVRGELESRGVTDTGVDTNIHHAEALGAVEQIKVGMDGQPISHRPRKSPKEILAQREARGEGPQSPKAVAAKKAAFLEKARSGDATLIEALSASNDVKGLQRAEAALAGEKLTPGVRSVTNAVQERMRVLMKDPDAAYAALLPKYSAQGVGSAASPDAQRAAASAYIDSVLPNVQTLFSNLPHAGEFERQGLINTIRISVHALDPRSVAYHEALHAWFAQLRSGHYTSLNNWVSMTGQRSNRAVVEPLIEAAETPHVLGQLRTLLKNEPDALKQLSDPEERAAYMFQFWANGQLQVDGAPKTLLTKIADFFRQVLGIWSNDERALHLLEYFHSGQYKADASDPNAVARATLEPGTNRAVETLKGMAQPLNRLMDTIAGAGGQRLRDTGVPALRELAALVKATGRDEGESGGFLPAARSERTRVMNGFGEALQPHERAHLDEGLAILQGATAGGSLQARTVAATTRKVLADMKKYMEAAGVSVSDLGPSYFPRVYDPSYISRHQRAFVQVLEAHGVPSAQAEEIMRRIITNDGIEFDVAPKPGMQHLKHRTLAHIPDSVLAPFMRKNLFEIMSSYVTQGTRRAEWARRFNDDSSKLNQLLDRATDEGATNADIGVARQYMNAVDGSLGDDINPGLRRLQGNLIVYQNIRLLPLAIFSSVVDPMGVMVRGGTVRDAWQTFARGMKEIRKTFQKDPQFDADTELAEILGVIDDAALSHTLGDLYTQGMVGETARKINDTFFRYNLMEGFSRSMRVGATRAAIRFIERHADGSASKHSERWLRELGLEPGSVPLQGGMLDLRDERVRVAVNTWVDGAVLRPDAADKPIWMSDPHWALVAHLKQFVFAFNETILKRVVHEYKAGNYTPAMALASYVPIMLAADFAKGMVQGGGEQPEWKRNWGAADYVWSAAQRAGLLGVGQFGADALGDVREGGAGLGALAGPTAEQLIDAVQAVGGREQFAPFALRSMPANALYAEAAR